MNPICRALLCTAMLLSLCGVSAGAPLQKHRSENVIFVMTDGLRWQEVFSGADPALLNKESGVKNIDGVKKDYWRETPEARREALMPFVWSVVARQGQLFGNPIKGSSARVTNGHNFSYPGYSETLCGFADPRVDSNKKVPNPNVTVFEWLNARDRFRGRVAAFGAWDVFPSIFNRDRCGFYINAGYEPMTQGKVSERVALLNTLKGEREIPRHWGGEPFDALTFYSALDYFTANKPRLFFLSLGETDEWAHEGRYDEYLDATRRADDYVKRIWETAQAMPRYRGKTSLIFSTDHGRGEAPTGWKSHGEEVAGSENIWMAFLGPDTPALGERTACEGVTQSQIAATLAALIDEDYGARRAASGQGYCQCDRTSPQVSGSSVHRKDIQHASVFPVFVRDSSRCGLRSGGGGRAAGQSRVHREL